MEEKVFIEKYLEPTEPMLEETLGRTYELYKELQELTKAFSHEWKYYNNITGWNYKIFTNNKVLLWLFPYNKKFIVGFALREEEREAVLNSRVNQEYKDDLKEAKKYAEGYGLRVHIRYKKNFKELLKILKILSKMRT